MNKIKIFFTGLLIGSVPTNASSSKPKKKFFSRINWSSIRKKKKSTGLTPPQEDGNNHVNDFEAKERQGEKLKDVKRVKKLQKKVEAVWNNVKGASHTVNPRRQAEGFVQRRLEGVLDHVVKMIQSDEMLLQIKADGKNALDKSNKLLDGVEPFLPRIDKTLTQVEDAANRLNPLMEKVDGTLDKIDRGVVWLKLTAGAASCFFVVVTLKLIGSLVNSFVPGGIQKNSRLLARKQRVRLASLRGVR